MVVVAVVGAEDRRRGFIEPQASDNLDVSTPHLPGGNAILKPAVDEEFVTLSGRSWG
jgi:hypothetical protein